MVIKGFKAYKAKCSFCEYEKIIPIRPVIPNTITFFDKILLPSRCPECGKKLIVKEDKRVVF